MEYAAKRIAAGLYNEGFAAPPLKQLAGYSSASLLFILLAAACNGRATPTPIPTNTSAATQEPATPTPESSPAAEASPTTESTYVAPTPIEPATPTATIKITPTYTPSPTPSPTLTPTVTPILTSTATATPANTPTLTATPEKPAPTATPTQTSTPTPISIKYLTDAEKQQLTSYFEKISQGWDQPSVDAANGVLSNETYGPKVWKSFFQGYFSSHPFTNDLRNYLGYPVYWWFSETAHANLQQGLFGSLTDIINSQTDAYFRSDRDSLTRDSPIIQSLMNSHRSLNDMIRLQAPGVEYQDDIFNFYKTLAKGEGLVGLIYGNAPLDFNKYPFAGALRAQAHMNLVDALDLTDSVRDQVIDTLKLDGLRRDIFKDYGVLVIDNQRLDETQLHVVQSLLDSVPNEMYNLRNITVNEFIGNTDDKSLWFLNKSGVNIFGLRVGNAVENGFPNDVLPYDADVFSLALAHEFNHVVDNFYVNGNNALKQRKEALLKQAGADRMNYLRSMIEDGFFQNAPQEFFASISNQYFASSEHTLELGIERLAQGRAEPLNQFLFFADVYSRGGTSTLFYTLDTSGNLTRREIPIVRDNQGYITGLNIGANQYRFQLDGKGNVLSVNKLQVNP